MEPALIAMSKTPWGTLENVSGPSQYVGDLVKAIDSAMEVVKDQVDKKTYLRNFYDKAATYVDQYSLLLAFLTRLISPMQSPINTLYQYVGPQSSLERDRS